VAATSRLDPQRRPALAGAADTRDLLLRAAFAPDDVARRAWQQAGSGLDLDTLPYELHALFPRIAERLRDLHIESADLPRFDGIRKRLWSQNLLRIRDVAAVCVVLRAHGIEPLLTGGLAVLAHRQDWGARPLTEADVAVPHDAHDRALAALSDDGWRVELARRDGFLLDMRASVLARGPGRVTLRSSPAGWPHDGLPAASVLDVGNSPLPVASRADVLAFLASDAERLPGYPPARRFADALGLCEGRPDQAPDWTAFVRRVVARKATPEAAEFVGYLRGPLCGQVPESIVGRLAALASGRASRPARRLDSSVVDAYRRRCRGGSALTNARMLPGYLCEVWDVDGVAKLPFATVGRAKRTIQRRLQARR
jgi:hypothetical protein